MLIKTTFKNIIKILTVLVIAVLFIGYKGTEVKAAETNNDSVTLTGYLIDEHCYYKKSDEPGKDTIGCLFMKGCIKGGYGIAVPKSDGTYQFYYFDGNFFTDTVNLDGTAGQKLAYDEAVKIKEKGERSNYLSVTVTGKLSGETKKSINGTELYPVLNLATIEETKTETITGYLIDEHCFAHKSADPGKDTKECLLMGNCIKGGYGIAAPQTDGTYKFYYLNGKFFTDVTKLDGTAGQKLAYDLIVASAKTDHVTVTVKGAFTGTNKPSINLQGVTYPTIDAFTLAEATSEEVVNLEKIISDAKAQLGTNDVKVDVNSSPVVTTTDSTVVNDTKKNSNVPKTSDGMSILYILIIFSISAIVVTFITNKLREAK